MQVGTAPAASTPPGAGAVPTPVAEALGVLSTIGELPLDEQPDAYQAIHEHLRSALADIDDA